MISAVKWVMIGLVGLASAYYLIRWLIFQAPLLILRVASNVAVKVWVKMAPHLGFIECVRDFLLEEPPQHTLVEQVRQTVTEGMETAWLQIDYSKGVLALELFGGFLLMIWLQRWLGSWIRRQIKLMIYSMRGIQYESIRQGSDFMKRMDPAYQVDVVDIGVLTVTHVGHGIRVGDYLVVPQHVRHSITGTPGLRKNGKVVAVEWIGVESKLLPDTYYAVISAKNWSYLEVARAPKAAKISRVRPASITSQGQGSSGIVQPSSTPGSVLYTGSTVAGFSGAAYFDATSWIGQHTGSQTAFNVGVAALVMQQEVRRITVQESNRPSDEVYHLMKEDWYDDRNVHDWVDRAYEREKHERQAEDDFHQMLDVMEGDDFASYDYNYGSGSKSKFSWDDSNLKTDWAEEMEMEYESLKKGDPSSFKEAMARSLKRVQQKRRQKKARKVLNLASTLVQGQGIESSQVEIEPKITPFMALSQSVKLHEKRITALENWRLGKSEPRQTKKVYCDACPRVFATKAALKQHQVATHEGKPVEKPVKAKVESLKKSKPTYAEKVVGESWPSDSDAKRVVAVNSKGHFLERFQKKTKPPSTNISRSSEHPSPSTSQQGLPLSTQVSITMLLENLENLQKGLNGLLSDITPK